MRKKSLAIRINYEQISKKYIEAFHEDMKALNCLPPTYEPTVTQTMPEIINFIKGLIEADKAYVSDGDVYFEIGKFPQYGRLSKHKLEDLIAGARVEVNEKKKNPLDFALWKHVEQKRFTALLRMSGLKMNRDGILLGGRKTGLAY